MNPRNKSPVFTRHSNTAVYGTVKLTHGWSSLQSLYPNLLHTLISTSRRSTYRLRQLDLTIAQVLLYLNLMKHSFKKKKIF